MKYLRLTDLAGIFPAALALGAGLVLIQPAPSLLGWLGSSALLLMGLAGLIAAWRWAGGGRLLAWMTLAAVLLRLGVGVATYLILPINGYDEPDDRAGFVFTDAHRRDDQAWQLASSGQPLWSAFDRSHYTDQYGGLLALSALSLQLFSGDVHRPLVVLTLAALMAALGVPFFFAAARRLWSEPLATAAAWLFVLYPESVLTGGAQMREPFLLTFIAFALWGFAAWMHDGERSGLLWIGIGMIGMLLVSPAIAVVTLLMLVVWFLVRRQRVHIHWMVPVAAAGLLLVGVLLLAWSLGSHGQFGGSPARIILGWFRDSVSWVIYQLERGSGQIQNVFSKLNPTAQFLFVVGYGIAQPVLPPAFLEPTTVTWHVIAILRGLGWYALLPLLLYAPFSLRHMASEDDRRTWGWLTIFSWTWILICAVRAGGDQWDNPRYRLIFFGVQALVASAAWLTWRTNRDPWLPRILAAELVCTLLFGQWYLARYDLIGIHLPILVVLTLGISSVLLIMGGGAIWDWLRGRRRPT